MRFIILFFCFLLSLTTAAQYTHTDIIMVNDGLLSNNIQALYTDSNNRLWLGSRAGLSVKKGSKFKPVAEAQKYKFNNIYDILEDPEQGKWIASYGQGVLYFNEKSNRLYTEKSGLVNNTVRALFYHEQKIYVGTLNGVSIISTEDFSISTPEFHQHPDYFFNISSFFTVGDKVFATTINDGIYEVTPQKLLKVSDIKRIFSSYVHHNHLYIGTEKELYEIDTTDFKVIKTFKVGSVHKFLSVANDLYLVSSGIYENKGGLFQLKKGQVINKTDDFNIPFTDLNSLAFDAKNQFLYIGSTNNGLTQINLDTPVFHHKNVGAVYTMSTFNDRQFIFHDAGFTIFSNHKVKKELSLSDFKRFQQQNPSHHQQHTIIQHHFYPLDYETPAKKIIFYNSLIHEHRLWVSTNIGLFELSLDGAIVAYHPIHIFHFTFFNNELIAAVPHAGVRIFHDINKMDYTYFHDWKQQEVPNQVVSIAQTIDAVYFASALSGLYEYKNGSFRSLLADQSFTESNIKRISTTKEGHLLVITDFNEIYLLDVSQPKVNILRHIPHNKIKGSSASFMNFSDEVLYVGTNMGINAFKDNRYFLIDRTQGFSNYNSTSATSDNNSLYIGTKQGVFELSKDYFKQVEALADEVVISAILVNNESLPTTAVNAASNQLKLTYKQNNVRLLFSVPNAKYPDKIKFKFRLKSTEPWLELIDENQLNLNYLNNGHYKIELQINNEDTGSVSEQHLLTLVIKPPFYYSNSFILGSALLLIVGSWLIYSTRINYLKRKQERAMALAALQSEQEKKELIYEKQLAHVKLQALKSQMNSHFLFNVLNSIQYFILNNETENASYYLGRFSKLIRTTLTNSDKKYISIYDEIQYLKQYLEIENLRVTYPIQLQELTAPNISTKAISIPPLLLQPFIENAIVHGFTNKIKDPIITIDVQKTASGYKIIITDNGAGYVENKRKNHESKGISLVQKQLQKPIEITYSEHGTQVVIYL